MSLRQHAERSEKDGEGNEPDRADLPHESEGFLYCFSSCWTHYRRKRLKLLRKVSLGDMNAFTICPAKDENYG